MLHAETSDILRLSDNACFFINSVRYGNFELPHFLLDVDPITGSESQ